jgi:murein DD-endopeptidase MepM/ murein hydrolase activator NlpD
MKTNRLVFLLVLVPLSGVYGDYPLIRYTVVSRDPLYSQQQEDVESWYSGGDQTIPLMIFRYVPLPSEDIFSVAAAFNLPYDALATLNSWDSPGLMSTGAEVLIPNRPGLFVPMEPVGRWERDLVQSRRSVEPVQVQINKGSGAVRTFNFFPGAKFSPEERVRFLGSLFTSPVADGNITSSFGYRPDPFTGGMTFHPGIDLRAPSGTPVYAARDGIVGDTGTLAIYGHYIILNHDGGLQSVYAHLERILVTKGTSVSAGTLIAESGNSGVSTGPHLHFEIRRNGLPTDPSRLTSIYD